MKRATISSRVAIGLGVVLLVVGAASVYFIGRSEVTTKTVTTVSNSYFTISDCTISAEGAVQIRVISDSSGQIINDAKLNGTLFNQCGNWYTDQFVPQEGGWFSPMLSTTVIGVFTVSIQYSGKTYSYAASISPIQVTCVTARLPSGNFTSQTYQIGDGAVCPIALS